MVGLDKVVLSNELDFGTSEETKGLDLVTRV